MTAPLPRKRRLPRKGDRRRHCPTGKAWYRDQLAAKMALAKLQDGPRRAYRCGLCGSWHLTSQPRRK